MFRGTSNLSMDDKGRLAVPAKHRDALAVSADGEIVLTAHPHGCLLLYPKQVWEPIEAKLMSLSSFDKKLSSYQRLLQGHVHEMTLDSAGRLLIAPTLREFAGLDKEVMLVGQGSHFEMWDMQAWRKQMAELMNSNDGEMPAELAGFSL